MAEQEDMTEREKAVRRFLIVAVFVTILVLLVGTITWQWLNQPLSPNVFDHGDYWEVRVGTIINPVNYRVSKNEDVEYVILLTDMYRITDANYAYRSFCTLCLKFEKEVYEDLGNGKWLKRMEPISELPADVHRWYGSGRIAIDEYRHKKATETPPN